MSLRMTLFLTVPGGTAVSYEPCLLITYSSIGYWEVYSRFQVDFFLVMVVGEGVTWEDLPMQEFSRFQEFFFELKVNSNIKT